LEQYFVDYLAWFTRSFEQLRDTIKDLPQEALDWVAGDDMNSLCVLVVHTADAGRFWMGEVPLGQVSKRDRTSEFEAKGVSISELNQKIDDVIAYAGEVMAQIAVVDMAKVCVVPSMHSKHPELNRDTVFEVTAGWSMLHALEHTAGHLGHAQITRQLWDQRQG